MKGTHYLLLLLISGGIWVFPPHIGWAEPGFPFITEPYAHGKQQSITQDPQTVILGEDPVRNLVAVKTIVLVVYPGTTKIL